MAKMIKKYKTGGKVKKKVTPKAKKGTKIKKRKY